MDLVTKIAFVTLAINAIVIAGGIVFLLYFTYECLVWSNIETYIKHYLSTNEHNKVEEYSKKLLESKQKYKQFWGYTGLAKKELQCKNYDTAIEYAEKAIEILPGEYEGYYPLLDSLFRSKQYYRALYYCFVARSKSVIDPLLNLKIASIFICLGCYDEARKLLETATLDYRESPLPDIFIAIIHYLERNNKLAIDFIRKAREKVKPSISDHSEVNEWAKGLLAVMSGDFKEGKYIFEYYSETSNFGPIFELILVRINEIYKVD